MPSKGKRIIIIIISGSITAIENIKLASFTAKRSVNIDFV
jgi:hypothetical protein